MENIYENYRDIIECAVFQGIIPEENKQFYLSAFNKEKDSDELESLLGSIQENFVNSDVSIPSRNNDDFKYNKTYTLSNRNHSFPNDEIPREYCDSVISGDTIENSSIFDFKRYNNSEGSIQKNISDLIDTSKDSNETSPVFSSTDLAKITKNSQKNRILDFKIPIYVDVKEKKAEFKSPMTHLNPDRSKCTISKSIDNKKNDSKIEKSNLPEDTTKCSFSLCKSKIPAIKKRETYNSFVDKKVHSSKKYTDQIMNNTDSESKIPVTKKTETYSSINKKMNSSKKYTDQIMYRTDSDQIMDSTDSESKIPVTKKKETYSSINKNMNSSKKYTDHIMYRTDSDQNIDTFLQKSNKDSIGTTCKTAMNNLNQPGRGLFIRSLSCDKPCERNSDQKYSNIFQRLKDRDDQLMKEKKRVKIKEFPKPTRIFLPESKKIAYAEGRRIDDCKSCKCSYTCKAAGHMSKPRNCIENASDDKTTFVNTPGMKRNEEQNYDRLLNVNIICQFYPTKETEKPNDESSYPENKQKSKKNKAQAKKVEEQTPTNENEMPLKCTAMQKLTKLFSNIMSNRKSKHLDEF